jgi:predicted kinase
VSAKACRNNNDLQGLKDIWDLVTGKATALLNKLLKELAEAKQELLNIKRQLDYLWQSIDYKLLKLYEQDRYAVYDATRTQLENRYKQLYAHYQMLLTVSGKKVGPTKLSFNFEC